VWTDLDSSLPLNSSANQLHEDNTALTSALLGIPGATEAYRTRLVQWARGVNVQQLMVNGSVTNSRHSVADPLHSPPVLVQYGGTEAAPKLLVFFTTNDGYLHAIDEATGEEVFAFVPQDLLARLPLLYQNIGTSQRPYGLDGTISVEITDINRNGIIEPSADGVTSGDRVVLYFGQRRGGSNLYALDVTNAAQATPSAKLLWTIRGGVTPGAGDLAGYEELGQTWSQPLPRSIRLNGVERRVVVFGGGYDTNQDSTTAVDSKGRGIFIADAETGERLWAAGNFAGADLLLSDMTYSIPSRLAAFDVDSDDLLDRIYVGDMGGQVWRIDLSPDNSNAATLATGGRIAALSGALETDHRRFYYPPDVALITDISGSYLALVMGSGYRAHPLDETFNDRIYMLRDYAVYDAPASHTALTEADLFDATDNTIGEGTALERAAAVAELDASRGWYIRLPTGEKSLSGALIVNGVALVPSFTPNSVNSADYDPCGPRSGVGAVYYLRVVNATPVYNFDGQGTDTALTLGDRKLTLNTPGIPPETAFIVTEQDGEVINAVLHGKEAGEDPSANNAVRTYWYEQ
jgi:type IV pilus assembly protein PilY1